MIKTLILACISATVALTSCNQTQKLKDADLARLEALSLKVSDNNLQVYANSSYSTSALINDKQCMIAYNNKLHALDIFDLDNQAPERQITLQNEGPDQVMEPTGMGVYQNTFIMASNSVLCRVSMDGKVISKLNLEDLPLIKEQGYTTSTPELNIYFSTYNFLGFDPETGRVALSLYKTEKEGKQYPKKIVVLSSEDWKQVGEIDIKDPDFISSEPIAALGAVHGIPYKDKVIYNYPASCIVYVADLKTNVVQEYNIQSSVAKPLYQLSDDPEGQGIITGYYFPLNYDPVREVFWRIQQQPVNGHGIAGKNFSLTCIQTDFAKNIEYDIPADQYIYSNLIYARSSILLPYFHGDKIGEDNMCFYGLEWDKE